MKNLKSKKELTEQIKQLELRRKELTSRERELVDNLTQKKGRLQKLKALLQNVSSLEAHIQRQKSELKIVCGELGLDIEKIVASKINVEPINDQISTVETEIRKFENDSNLNFAKDIEPESFESLPDLRFAIRHVSEEIDNLKDKLGTPQRKYQNYLEKLAVWNAQKNEILGDTDDPRPGTIKYLKEKNCVY